MDQANRGGQGRGAAADPGRDVQPKVRHHGRRPRRGGVWRGGNRDGNEPPGPEGAAGRGGRQNDTPPGIHHRRLHQRRGPIFHLLDFHLYFCYFDSLTCFVLDLIAQIRQLMLIHRKFQVSLDQHACFC